MFQPLNEIVSIRQPGQGVVEACLVELLLEPTGFPPAQTYQKALFAAGIPATVFMTKDVRAEFQRLKGLGVNFRGEPKAMGPITAVLFEDTCGNLINLVQPTS